MRAAALIAMLMVAGCGEAPANKAAPAAAAPAAGEWQITAEVTRFRKADDGTPRINTPAGTRTTESVCVGAGDQLPSAMFSGANFTCTYPSYYVRGGRLNLTLNCRRPGLSGDIPMTVNGTFAADSIEFTRNVRTALASDGDVEIDSRVTGRRTGACAPASSEGGNRQ